MISRIDPIIQSVLLEKEKALNSLEFSYRQSDIYWKKTAGVSAG